MSKHIAFIVVLGFVVIDKREGVCGLAVFLTMRGDSAVKVPFLFVCGFHGPSGTPVPTHSLRCLCIAMFGCFFVSDTG